MLLSICDNPSVLEILRIIRIVIQFIKVIVPIILIFSLLFSFAKAVYSDDNDLLARTSKSAIPKTVAAILVFFVPTFVNLIVGATGDNVSYMNCLKNSTNEKIDEAYIAQAQVLVNEAKEKLSRSSYNLALSKVNKLKISILSASLIIFACISSSSDNPELILNLL